MNKKFIQIGLIVFALLAFSSLAFAQTTNINHADNLNISIGSVLSGTLSNTFTSDGEFLSIQEQNHSTGLLFEITFENVEGNITNLITNQRYIGGASHNVVMSVYNCETQTYDLLKTYGNTPNFERETYDLSYLNTSCNPNITLKYEHPQSGIESHNFDIEYLTLVSVGESEPVKKNIFLIDLDDTFTIIMIVLLFMISLFLIISKINIGLGSGLIMIIGFLLFLNDFNILFTTTIITLGIVFLFRDEND